MSHDDTVFWSLVVQVDAVFFLSEGRLSDVLLDLSGLTRVKRVTIQASTENARSVELVSEALITQHPRVYLHEIRRRAARDAGKGKDSFMLGGGLTSRWHLGEWPRREQNQK